MSGLMDGTRRGAGIMLAALFTIGAAGCDQGGDEAEAAQERPILLGSQDVAVATMRSVGSGVIITGSLQPAYSAKVKAQVPGTVLRILADRGTAVAQGQPLAAIAAEGIRGQAEGARAGVAAADANLALARQRLESARTLRDAGAMSAIDYSAAQAGYEAAVAQAASARAQAAGADEMAGRATVRAPIDGVVGERVVEEGESVSIGDDMFTVVRSDVLELSGSVPVDAAAQIRPGQTVVFTLSANPGAEFRGEVSRIEPMADPETRQVGVYLRLRNPGGVIGGQFATGRIEGRSMAEVVVIPEVAVRGDGADMFVMAVVDGRAVKRQVTVGTADPATGLIAIVSGLQAGEQVIVTPSATIAEGALVQLGPSAMPAAAPGDSTEGR